MGLCKNALKHNCYVHVGPCSLCHYFRSPGVILSSIGVILSSPFPTPPRNVVAKKSTHFHPFCSQFNFVWSGRGGVASFSNIPLTSIIGSANYEIAGVNRGNSLPLALNDSSASTHKRHCIQGTKHLWKNNHLFTEDAWYNKRPRAAKTIGTCNTRGKLF